MRRSFSPYTHTTFCANHPTTTSSSSSLSGPSQRPKLPSSSGALCCVFFFPPLSSQLQSALSRSPAPERTGRGVVTDEQTKRRPDGQMMKKPGHMAPLWRDGPLIPKRARGFPVESTGSTGCRDLTIKMMTISAADLKGNDGDISRWLFFSSFLSFFGGRRG